MLGIELKKPVGTGALIWLVLAAVILILDQATKIWLQLSMDPHETVAVLPFFNITYLTNPGAAFSLLADAGGWQRWLFSLVAVVVSIGIVIWLWYLPRRGEAWLACGLVLILGGALGNLVDRLVHGEVIDFIQVYWGEWSWPAFNVADSAITVGAIIIIIDSLRGARRPAR